MNDDMTHSIRKSYDELADEYTRRIFDELRQKPFDRQLLDRFAADVAEIGEVCDMGCGPGHVARGQRLDKGQGAAGHVLLIGWQPYDARVAAEP